MLKLSLEAIGSLQALVKVLGSQRISASLFWTDTEVKLYLDAQGAALIRFTYQMDESLPKDGSALFDFSNFSKILSSKPKELTLGFERKVVTLKTSTGTTIFCPVERDELNEPTVFETTSLDKAQRERGLLDEASRSHILKHSRLLEMNPEAPLLIDVTSKGRGTVCASNGQEAVWLEFKTSQSATQMTVPSLALKLAAAVPNVDVYILPQLLLLKCADESLDMAVSVLDVDDTHTSKAILGLFETKDANPIDLTDALRIALTSVALVSDSARIVPHPKQPKKVILEGFQNGTKSAKHILTAVSTVGFFALPRVVSALSIIKDASNIKQTSNALLVTAPGVGAGFLYSSEA